MISRNWKEEETAGMLCLPVWEAEAGAAYSSLAESVFLCVQPGGDGGDNYYLKV